MKTCKHLFALGGSAVLALASFASAEAPTTGDADVRAEMAAMKARIAELESRQNVNWLDERKAEQVKGLVREVLADADNRASLLQDGATAGHQGSNFFLASGDGSFLMKISGQIQLRHVANFRDDDGSEDDSEFDEFERGFEIRRAKIEFSGHVADPRIKYAVRILVDRAYNGVYADKITLGYDLTDTLYIWGGEDKAPFLREELISSSRQLAVERSLVNEVFTAGYVQGVGLIWKAHEQVKVQVMINDGFRSGEPDVALWTQQGFDDDGDPVEDDFDLDVSKRFHEDRSDFAVTARVDLLLSGEWSQWKDTSAWGGEETAVFLGGAFHWEEGETGDGFLNNDFYAWTVDGSIESNGLGLFIAFTGFHTDNESPAEEIDSYGLVVQGSYNINDKFEPFIRYEWIDLSDVEDIFLSAEDELNILTFGFNHYFNKHDAKFTLDLVWALDPVPGSTTSFSGNGGLNGASTSGLGLLWDEDDEDGQIAVRAQFQLLF